MTIATVIKTVRGSDKKVFYMLAHVEQSRSRFLTANEYQLLFDLYGGNNHYSNESSQGSLVESFELPEIDFL